MCSKHSMKVFLAGLLALICAGILPSTTGAQPRPDRYDWRHDRDRGRQQSAYLPWGVEPRSLGEQREIRSSFITAIGAAVNPGGLDNLVDQLATPDRNRIGNFPNQRFAELDDALTRLQRHWYDRYGTDLDVRQFWRAMGRDFGLIEEGSIRNPRRLTDWPLDPIPGARVTKTEAGEENNLERDRNVAVFVLPQDQRYPRVVVSLIQERYDGSTRWRIDIPDSVDGPRLERNLLRTVRAFDDNRDYWPRDPIRAYQTLARRVILAVYGLEPMDREHRDYDRR